MIIIYQWGRSQGISVPLFFPEINWLVPLFLQNQKMFSYVLCFAILSLFPCSPPKLALVHMFPWNKRPFSTVPQIPGRASPIMKSPKPTNLSKLYLVGRSIDSVSCPVGVKTVFYHTIHNNIIGPERRVPEQLPKMLWFMSTGGCVA